MRVLEQIFTLNFSGLQQTCCSEYVKFQRSGNFKVNIGSNTFVLHDKYIHLTKNADKFSQHSNYLASLFSNQEVVDTSPILVYSNQRMLHRLCWSNKLSEYSSSYYVGCLRCLIFLLFHWLIFWQILRFLYKISRWSIKLVNNKEIDFIFFLVILL